MEGTVYGYARVSSKEQNLDRQLLALKEYVEEEHIVVDKASGINLNRPGYQALVGPLGLRSGDTLYIVSLDRLSRNKQEMKMEIERFKNRGIRLKVLDLPTSMIEVPKGQEWILDMITNILIEVLSSIAEQERELIKKRQREGIAAARAKGKYLGRPRKSPPDNWNQIVERWRTGEITANQAMKESGLKRTTFYKFIKEHEHS